MIKRIKSLLPRLTLAVGIVIAAVVANGIWNTWWGLGSGASEAEAPPVVVEILNDIELIGCVRKVCVYAFNDDGDRCRLAIFSPFVSATRIDLECP